MEDQIIERNIDITFDSKSSPDFSFEKPDIELSLVKQDFDFYLQKHPEIEFIFKSTFIGGGGSGNSSIEILTPIEWAELTEKDPKTIYMIVDGNELKRLYIGQFLIGRSQEDGSIGFPYNFPIIF